MSQPWVKIAVAVAATFAVGGLATPGASYAADNSSVQIQICSGGPAFQSFVVRGTNQNWQTFPPVGVALGPYNIPAIGCDTPVYGYWWKKGTRLLLSSQKPGDVKTLSDPVTVPNTSDAVAKVWITDNKSH
ncbi:hypothetical protein BCF44_12643 [Kutzneria buriramensis]|uniref:Uncharacterized protein n=2 Tax=Kutzneria buriramensis TaxID=1045776 RepID=A0A3E0GUN3_9PSEU|nr:hypothetical protein BCF44_12643 [Kutzneria buriramensis]